MPPAETKFRMVPASELRCLSDNYCFAAVHKVKAQKQAFWTISLLEFYNTSEELRYYMKSVCLRLYFKLLRDIIYANTLYD